MNYFALAASLLLTTNAFAITGAQDQEEAKKFKTIRSLIEGSTASLSLLVRYSDLPAPAEEGEVAAKRGPESDAVIIQSVFCSGTVVSPNAILTAAHCVLAGELKAIAKLVEKDPSKLVRISFSGGQELLEVAEMVVHPGFKANANAFGAEVYNDVALIRLKEKLPADRVPVELNQKPISSEVAVPAYIAGYGITRMQSVYDRIKQVLTKGPKDRKTDAAQDSGTLRVARAMVKQRKHALSGQPTIGVADGQANICSGDSGGPTYLLRGGRLILAGVHSTGACQYGMGDSMPVSNYLGWIRQTLSERAARLGE